MKSGTAAHRHNTVSGKAAGRAATLGVLFLAVVISGCSIPSAKLTKVPLPPSAQKKAVQKEVDREYLDALRYWRQAAAVVDGKISAISASLREIAAGHAQRGVELYAKREGEAALQAFFQALRHDSANKVALDYLNSRYAPRQLVPYTVAQGDTLASIAEKVYGSSDDVFAVTLFSGVVGGRELVEGEILHLPQLDSFYSQSLLDYKRDILVARKLYRQDEFAELLPLAEKILKDHPQDDEASYLLNSALVGLGGALRKEEKYEQAIGFLSRVDPVFKNVKVSIAEIRELQKLKLAEDAMQLNSELFEKGELLYSQRKYLEALRVFREVDPQFEGVQAAIANTLEVIGMQAEIHYKRGVKYFVEDDLTAAIREWQQTIAYEPGHSKAIDNIIRARQLLKKVEALN